MPLTAEEIQFQECVQRLAVAAELNYPLADLNDLLTDLGGDEFQDAVAGRP